ncbi:MAG: hypothetical protein QOG67_2469 [Verrucomicrobiota bacterium]
MLNIWRRSRTLLPTRSESAFHQWAAVEKNREENKFSSRVEFGYGPEAFETVISVGR